MIFIWCLTLYEQISKSIKYTQDITCSLKHNTQTQLSELILKNQMIINPYKTIRLHLAPSDMSQVGSLRNSFVVHFT
jgi:hypothetical protein